MTMRFIQHAFSSHTYNKTPLLLLTDPRDSSRKEIYPIPVSFPIHLITLINKELLMDSPHNEIHPIFFLVQLWAPAGVPGSEQIYLE